VLFDDELDCDDDEEDEDFDDCDEELDEDVDEAGVELDEDGEPDGDGMPDVVCCVAQAASIRAPTARIARAGEKTLRPKSCMRFTPSCR
jgi:hypothetical protein